MSTCQYEIIAGFKGTKSLLIKYGTLQLVRFIPHLALETARRMLDIDNIKMPALLPVCIMALFAMGRCVSGIGMALVMLFCLEFY